MGIFDKLLKSSDEPLSAISGMLLAALTVVGVDGNIDDNEFTAISLLNCGPVQNWDAAINAWKERTLEECISLVVASLNPEQRLVTMANLIDLAMTDGTLASSEKWILEAYVKAFDIDVSKVKEFVNFVSIKNNREIF